MSRYEYEPPEERGAESPEGPGYSTSDLASSGFATAEMPPSEEGELPNNDPRHPDRRRREGLSPLWIAVILLLLVLASVAGWWWLTGRAPGGNDPARPQVPAPPPPAPAERPAVTATEPAPRPDLPPLNQSDSVIRQWVSQLSQHPQLAKWLVPEDLVRRFVTTVDNVSRGTSPRPHLGVIEPRDSFTTTRRGSRVVAAPAAYQRYDLVVEVLSSLDIAASARLFHDVEPLFEEAYQELGDPSRDFRTALTEAIDRLLAVDVPAEPPVLVRGVTTYRYADPELEALDPASKHLLRLGPENARKVQSKLRFFRAALDLPGTAPGAPAGDVD